MLAAIFVCLLVGWAPLAFAVSIGTFWAFFPILVLVPTIYIGVSLGAASTICRKTLGGRPPKLEDRMEGEFVKVLEELSISAGVPTPQAVVVDDLVPNAFAYGLSPRKSVVGVNRGGLEAWTREELEGVVGHELGHIKNRDTSLRTVVGASFGFVDLLTHRLAWLVRTAGKLFADAAGSAGEAIAAVLFLLVVTIVLTAALVLLLIPLWIARFLARIVLCGFVRAQEFRADARAVELTRNPDGIARALKKVHEHRKGIFHARGNRSSFLFVGKPAYTRFERLYASHPPIEKRMTRILGQAVTLDSRGRLLMPGESRAPAEAPGKEIPLYY